MNLGIRPAKLAAMRCGLCNRDVPKLVKSHIVPEAMMLHNQPKGRAQPLLMLSTEAYNHPKRCLTGTYSKIVCHDCEQSFKRGDDALLGLLRSVRSAPTIRDGQGNIAAKVFPDVDVGNVHRGILTTLFRAHLSDHENYKKVDVTPFVEALSQALLSSQSTLQTGFDVFLRVVETAAGSITPDPFRQQMDGVDVWTLYFPHITAYIKLDCRPFGPVFSECILRANATVMAIWRPEISESELEVIRKSFTTHSAALQKYYGTNGL